MANLQYLSILLEAVIALLFVSAALKGRTYLFGMAVTFAIYVAYDLSKLGVISLPESSLTLAFFIATLAALWSAWGIAKR